MVYRKGKTFRHLLVDELVSTQWMSTTVESVGGEKEQGDGLKYDEFLHRNIGVVVDLVYVSSDVSQIPGIK